MWLFSSLLSFFVIVRSGDGGVGDEGGGEGNKGAGLSEPFASASRKIYVWAMYDRCFMV